MNRTDSRFLLFFRGGLGFGIPVSYVEGATAAPAVTALPHGQSRVVRGLVYTFGKIAPLIDCAPLMNVKAPPTIAHLIVVLVDGEHYAFAADSLDGLKTGTLKKHPATIPIPSQRTVILEKKSIIILDVSEIISRHVCT